MKYRQMGRWGVRSSEIGLGSYLTMDYDEQEMETAIQEARRTFGQLKSRLNDPKPGDSDFFIKVKITDENGTEHFWLQDVKIAGDRFEGIINNEPGIVKNVKIGERYRFGFKDVSDWMYRARDGAVRGNYTLRVILKTMPKQETEQLNKMMGW